jgi:hypothetical protein
MRIAKYTFGVGSDSAFSVPLALAVPSEVTIDTPPAAIPVTTATVLTGTVAPSGAAVAVVDGTTVLGAATVVGTTWTFSWTPGVAAIGAHPSVHATSGSANSAPVSTTVALAEDFAAIAGGPDQLHWARSGEEYVTLSGSDVTQWQDLSGHGNHATDGTDRPVYVDAPGGDSYLDFTGANNDHLLVPYAWANGCTAFTIFFSGLDSGSPSYGSVLGLFSQLGLRYYAGSLNVLVGAAQATWEPVLQNIDHAIVLVYDGALETPSQRLRVWVDGEERFSAAPPEWPASITSIGSGAIGQRGALEDQDLQGRVHALGLWYDVALDDTAVAALCNVLRGTLSYASAWTPTGTTLIEHTLAPLSIGAEIALTEDGLSISAGTPIVVHDKGAAHAGMTALEDRGAGVYRVYFKYGTGHVGPDDRIVYSESADYGATWGAPVDLVDTPGICDGDPRVESVEGVSTLFWVRFVSDTNLQLVSRPVAGGAVTNVMGYPLISGAHRVTSRGASVDEGAIVVSYGGPAGGSGWLCTRIGGTDVYWTPAAYAGTVPYLIYEPCTVRLMSGGLMAVTRTGYPASATGPCLQIRSLDDGVTWSDARLFPATHGGEPLGIDAPFLLQMSTGTLVVVGRRRNATGVPLTLLYSMDDGVSWSAPVDMLDLVNMDGGYCGIIEVDPTHILISYYCQYAGLVQRIAVLPVTIEAA